jgi:uncharacterized damage-inducible protein DinB
VWHDDGASLSGAMESGRNGRTGAVGVSDLDTVPAALDALALLVPRLEVALDGLGDRQLRIAEGPGKWSVLEVVQHLADTELVYAHRVRLALTEETPALPRFAQERWAERLRYGDARLPEVLGQLRSLRARNLRLFRALGEAELARTAVHDSRGTETVGAMIVHLARHDAKHCAQIARIRQAVGGPAGYEVDDVERGE